MGGFTINGCGATDKFTPIKSLGTFSCPGCGNVAEFTLDEVKRKIKVFYIPTATLSIKYAIMCKRCERGRFIEEHEKNGILNGTMIVEATKDGIEVKSKGSASPGVRRFTEHSQSTGTSVTAASSTASSPTCPDCGCELQEGAVFCWKCGCNLSERAAAEEASSPRTCPDCGCELQEAAMFCWKCGCNLSERAAAEEAPSPRTCPDCGCELTEDALFCLQCGCNLSERAAAEEAPSPRTCPDCGCELAKDAMFCLQCGKKLSSDLTSPVDDSPSDQQAEEADSTAEEKPPVRMQNEQKLLPDTDFSAIPRKKFCPKCNMFYVKTKVSCTVCGGELTLA